MNAKEWELSRHVEIIRCKSVSYEEMKKYAIKKKKKIRKKVILLDKPSRVKHPSKRNL